MSKILVDRALIEQAIEALTKSVLFCNHMGVGDWQPTAMACHSGIAALRAALVQPAVEPVAVVTDVDEYGPKLGWYEHWALFPVGTKLYAPAARKPSQMLTEVRAMFASPPPAEPARTSQDVCTVPLLSDDEVAQCIKDASKGSAINRDGSTSQRIVRSAEQLVRRKAGL